MRRRQGAQRSVLAPLLAALLAALCVMAGLGQQTSLAAPEPRDTVHAVLAVGVDALAPTRSPGHPLATTSRPRAADAGGPAPYAGPPANVSVRPRPHGDHRSDQGGATPRQKRAANTSERAPPSH